MGSDDIRLFPFQETGLSIETILIIFIHLIVLTNFVEEIMFRGFLINSPKYRFGFNISIHIQTLLFTILHIFVMLGFSLVDIAIGTIIIY